MSMIEHTASDATIAADPSARSQPTVSPQSAVDARFRAAGAYVLDRVWDVLHVLGAHRWSEGYEVDPERGMTRYRGSRCTICDNPWEGW